jgi:hypothetical protein
MLARKGAKSTAAPIQKSGEKSGVGRRSCFKISPPTTPPITSTAATAARNVRARSSRGFRCLRAWGRDASFAALPGEAPALCLCAIPCSLHFPYECWTLFSRDFKKVASFKKRICVQILRTTRASFVDTRALRIGVISPYRGGISSGAWASSATAA